MYAVVEMQGHQYIVQKGLELVVDKIQDESAKTLVVNEVVMAFDKDGEKVMVGKPYLKAQVTFDVMDFVQGDKIKVLKFKRKNRYQRVFGHRSKQVVLKVKQIELNG